MEQEFIDKMQAALNEMKKDLLETLAKNNEEFRRISDTMDSKDDIDIASDNIDRKLLETMGENDYNRLQQIDEALTRIEQGEYGLCQCCGNLIPQPRLEAMPYTALCIQCKSEEEKNRF